jgi:hypothetical protein
MLPVRYRVVPSRGPLMRVARYLNSILVKRFSALLLIVSSRIFYS